MNEDTAKLTLEAEATVDVDDSSESFLTEVKKEINQVLFMNLPGDTTLAELEDIAVDLYNRVEAAWFRVEDD